MEGLYDIAEGLYNMREGLPYVWEWRAEPLGKGNDPRKTSANMKNNGIWHGSSFLPSRRWHNAGGLTTKEIIL